MNPVRWVGGVTKITPLISPGSHKIVIYYILKLLYSGIEFEADSAALDSILNDTGIQVPVSVPGIVSRHTIATAAIVSCYY